METTITLQTEKMLDEDSLLLTSMIFMGANQTIRDVHVLVTAFLRYATIGASITHNLMGSMVNSLTDQD